MITPNPNGITVKFFTPSGVEDPTQQVQGQAKLFTTDRPADSNEGSLQWLSNVYIAHNPANLAHLQTIVAPVGSPEAGTSGSSRGSTLVIEGRPPIQNAWVIALDSAGNPATATAPYIADTLHVSPNGPFTSPGNPQAPIWHQQSILSHQNSV